jgi:ribosome-binding protein aMBF1 (putative translation factor)
MPSLSLPSGIADHLGEGTMEDIRTQLGERIRSIRKTMGWSQEELGHHADLHSTYIGQLERGESVPWQGSIWRFQPVTETSRNR